jgi:hypothetical protein
VPLRHGATEAIEQDVERAAPNHVARENRHPRS